MAKVKTKMKHPVLCVFFVILTILSLLIASYGGRVTRELTRRGLNFNELTPETAIDGSNTNGIIYASNGTYGQQYKLDENGNIIESAPMDYFYLVPVSDNYCITIVTDDEEIVNKLFELTLATEKFNKGETETIEYPNFYYSGRLKALNDDELLHLYAWALSDGMFGAEDKAGVDKYIIPYKIYTFDKSVGLPFLIVGSVLFAFSAVMILVLIKQRVAADDDDDDDDF